MVVVSNGWLEHAAEVQSFLQANGLTMSSATQPAPSNNPTAAILETIESSTTITPSSVITNLGNGDNVNNGNDGAIVTTTTSTSSLLVSASTAIATTTATTATIPTIPKTTTTGFAAHAKAIVSAAARSDLPNVIPQQIIVQQQQQQIQLNNNNKTNGNQPAKAILKCRPNSHPFQNRTLILEPNQEVKVGRSVARHRVAENNAIFDCKVLSRNHAVLWYNDGKFFIRDTGSSNGTFINNQRLSQTCCPSEQFEVSSGDIVQFGVDVMENSRKETHGCIVATLKLFLPDGRETKASQSTCVGTASSNIPQEDLYRLNQYIQEAVQREQMLETKLIDLQKIIELAKKNANNNWQAMIDEDRLLNRIDILENKLQCFQKNTTDDKLREEVLKLQEDKLVYQNLAKEALRKVYKERYDAIQKLSSIERALCSSEDECSLLRDQLLKSQEDLQETLARMSSLQQKYDELFECYNQIEVNEKYHADEIESMYRLFQEQMFDIIRTKDQLDNVLKEKFSLQKLLGLLKTMNEEKNENENETTDGDDDNTDTDTKNESYKKQALVNLFANSDIKNLEGSEDIIKSICNDTEQGNDELNMVQLHYAKTYDKLVELEKKFPILETIKNKNSLAHGSQSSLDSNATDATLSDGNQNVNEITTGSDNGGNGCGNNGSGGSQSKIYNDLMTGVVQVREIMKSRQEANDKVEEMEMKLQSLQSELQTLTLELQTRPTYNQYQEKVKLSDDLQIQLVSLQLKVSELREYGEKMELTKKFLETELNNIKHDDNNKHAQNKIDVELQTELLDTRNINFINNDQAMMASSTPENFEQTMENELNILNDPIIEREEELILFKEKYAKLTEENILLRQDYDEIKRDLNNLRNKSLTTLMMYFAPFVVIIGYLLISPYL